GAPITIGYPVQNSIQYIVDTNLNMVPQGVPGELVIGGAIVASGYLNRPDLTAERFIPDHFVNNGSLMYRTGDIAKWTKDGQIQLMGRIDDMVKVKGYRIELDEVAKAVSKHPSVTGCAVLVKDNYLVAYLTPADADVDDIREMVYEMLPTYMIPASYFTMEKFPLNSNEK
ncbi:hypothetical protein BC833DRAFT_510322, partial [Globomyces pollinis-pini]